MRKCGGHKAFLACKERHIPSVADYKPVGAIEVGRAVRVVQVGLVIDGCVECRVAAGGCVQRLRPCVCTKEVEGAGETVRSGDLQGVIVRPRVAGKELIVLGC